MQEAERFSNLIGDIYDAALDPSLWIGTLAKVRDFVRGTAAALYSKDAANKNGEVYHDDGGIDPLYRQLYFDKYVKFDPTTTGHFFADLLQPISTTDLMDYDEFRETRFYTEWAQPQGLVDSLTMVLDKSVTSAALFSVFRHERDGLADDEARRRIKLVAPHMRRAVLIGRVIDLGAGETASFANTLDGLSAAMFLVTDAGRIVHANASGHDMIAGGDILRAAEGYLVACDPQANQALREVFTAAGSGDAAVGVKGIAVPLARAGGERHVAHILPVTSGARRQAGASYAAVAALFVHKAALQAPSSAEMIAKLYKLTPSELRVWLAIVQAGGISETAAALGIGEATVKTHLHRLFAKTGAGSQADLVRLIAGFANPLIGRME